MKKLLLGFVVCLVAFSVPGCSKKTIDKDQYTAIDPFDYKLDEKNAPSGAVRKFKSVVKFGYRNENVLTFFSLDEQSTLEVTVAGKVNNPNPAQLVTIYYTASKKILDTLVLDEIDYGNTTEAGINLEKSVPHASGINKADYREIDPFDYKIEAEGAQWDEVRHYASSVLFSAQHGLTFYFLSQTGGTMLSMRASQRFPVLSEGQKVTVYYTATKKVVDSLSLDDIEQ